MKKQIENIEYMIVRHIGKNGDDLHPQDPGVERVRLSIAITADDSHHIEISKHESRYRLSGLLHRLAQSVADGI